MAHRWRLPCRAFPCGRGWEVGGGRGPRELREIRDSPWLTRITLPFALFCPRVIATTALTWIVSSIRTLWTQAYKHHLGVLIFFWNFTRLALQYFQTLSPPGQCLSQILPLRTSMFALKSFFAPCQLRGWARGAVYWMRRKVWGLIIIQRILPLFS